MRRAAVQSIGLCVVFALCLFVTSGRPWWPMAWAFLAFQLLYAVAGVRLVDPALVDERTRWQRDARPRDVVLGTAAFVLLLPSTLVVLTNPFFSTVVRIQRDRGHHVVEAGPYAIVRHPGYAGALAGNLALPVALGSVWALVPTLVGFAALGLRLVDEDRTLANELPGYRTYMARVPWRLCRHVW